MRLTLPALRADAPGRAVDEAVFGWPIVRA